MTNKPLFAKFGAIQKFNSQFSKCNVAIAYAGDNRNYSSISKETFEKMIPSLHGVPVIGEWKGEDFGSHGGKIEITDDGVKYVETTKPFGYIDSQAKVWWEEVTEENGTVREYLMTECFLWTSRYPEAQKVLEGESNQSMEIAVKSGEPREDGIFNITDAEFSALCILGTDVEPAFESSGFSQFNLDKDVFKSEFNLMVKELKESFSMGGENVTKEQKFVETEPVEVVEPEVVEVVEPVVEEAEELTETVKDTVETEVPVEETPVVETVEEPIEPTVEVVAEVTAPEQFTKTFALSHDDIRSKLYQMIYSVEEEDNDWYYISQVYDDYFVYVGETKNYKQSYVKTDVDVALSGERIELFVEYLTKEELAEVSKLRTDYDLLATEVEALNLFKADTLADEKEANLEVLFENYSALLDNSEIADLKESAMNMELIDVEKELSFRVVHKKFDFTKVVKKDSTKVTINGVNKGNEPYGSASVYFNK